jgi:hypothetical protein
MCLLNIHYKCPFIDFGFNKLNSTALAMAMPVAGSVVSSSQHTTPHLLLSTVFSLAGRLVYVANII